MTRTGRPFRLRWVVLGLLLLELGWLLVLPPFRGMDEWDHAYRASAVANGQWLAEPSDATRGTGAVVRVESDIVEAARPECARLPYTGPEECRGESLGAFTSIASGAGRYHPAFYAVTGAVSRVTDGVAAMYGMRVVAMLLCLSLLSLSLVVLRSWAGPTVALAVVLGLTPMVVYTDIVLAPNGVEVMSGLALWAALGGIAHQSQGDSPDAVPIRRLYLAAALVSTTLLLTVRSLGPLWAALIVITAVVAWPGLLPRLLSFFATRRGIVSAAWLVVVAAASLLWIRSQSALVLGTLPEPLSLTTAERAERAASEIPLWILQWIGVFPYRDQPAPPLVYGVFIVALGAAFGMAVWRGRGRERLVILGAVAMALIVPFIITMATVEEFGKAWQGRYALPYLLGVPLLVGTILARQSKRARTALLIGVPLAALGHVTAACAVLADEQRRSPLSGEAAWALEPTMGVVIAIMTLGAAVLFVPLSRSALREAA